MISLTLWGRPMREVEIIEDSSDQRRWVAVDTQTRKPVLRLHEKNLLRNVCQNLGWQIAPANSESAHWQGFD